MKIEELLEGAISDRLKARQATVAANTGGQNTAPVDNTVPFPKQAGTTQPAATGPTGDATLDQPLPAAAPKKPGGGFIKGLANVVGQTAKGIGAVAGAPAGIARAVKKGYTAGADAIGGPGAAPTVGTTGTASSAANAGASDELADLRSQLQVMQQKLARAGIQQ
jgi:hypothetical protein